MNNKAKDIYLSFLIVGLFVTPHTVQSFLPKSITPIYLYVLLFCYFLMMFSYFRSILLLCKSSFFLFLFSFIITGSFNLVIHESNATFNILCPFITLMAYICISNIKNFSFKILDAFFIFLYIFYLIVYFLKLPDLFSRPGFDENIFDNSSSNSISIGLNITLYIYIVLNDFFKANNFKNIFVLSFINIILIIIQQSRAGIIIALVLLFIAYYQYKEKFGNFFINKVLPFIFVLLVLTQYVILKNYIDIVGNVGISSLGEDIRGEAQRTFFSKMTLFNFFFGYPPETSFTIDYELKYTYNTFLDIWNRYGIFQFIIVFIVFSLRILNRKNYQFPLYYLIPFLIYSFVEPRFFPNYWDFFICLLLFVPKNR